jgi:hypothetical protein
MLNRALPAVRINRRRRSLALVAVAAAGVGCVAGPAAAAPTIAGNDVWGIATPDPEFTISSADPAGFSWALDANLPEPGVSPLVVKFPALAEGAHTLTATDLSSGDPSVTKAFRVDLTPPKVTVTRPVGGAQYDVGASVLAEYVCEEAVTCAGPVPSGTAIDTSAAGMRSFKVTATDDAGNEAISIVDYIVRAPGTTAGGASATPSEPITLVPRQDPKPRATPFRPRTLNVAALRPRVGLKVPTRTPLLRWTKRDGATLYNVQIYWLRGKTATKVASLFPRGGNVRVPRGRVAYGKTYIWRVWPYVKGRYTSRPLGLSYFSVKRAPTR